MPCENPSSWRRAPAITAFSEDVAEDIAEDVFRKSSCRLEERMIASGPRIEACMILEAGKKAEGLSASRRDCPQDLESRPT